MKPLLIILSLLSLTLLSAQSLSAPISAVDELCRSEIGHQHGEQERVACMSLFASYPKIHEASPIGVALIANNVAQQRLNTFIASINTFLSEYSGDELKRVHMEKCLKYAKSDVAQALQNAEDFIMKGEFTAAFKEGVKTLGTEFNTLCSIQEMPAKVRPSYNEFTFGGCVSYMALTLVDRELKSSH